MKALLGYINRLWWRVRHGYNPKDCWNLDHSLAKWLAPRLRHLAEQGHTYPGRAPYPYTEDSNIGYEKWVSDLMLHSSSLALYATQYGEYMSLEDEMRMVENAHTAMKWVGEWFLCLWD